MRSSLSFLLKSITVHPHCKVQEHSSFHLTATAERFELQVLGKHGVTVDSVLHEPSGDPVPLQSRSFVQIGTVASFYFLLPKKKSKLFKAAKTRVTSQAPAEPSDVKNNDNDTAPGPHLENNDNADANEARAHLTSSAPGDSQPRGVVASAGAPADLQAGGLTIQWILAQQRLQQQLLGMIGQEHGQQAALYMIAAEEGRKQQYLTQHQMALRQMLLTQQQQQVKPASG